jgi:hypothetical protein
VGRPVATVPAAGRPGHAYVGVPAALAGTWWRLPEFGGAGWNSWRLPVPGGAGWNSWRSPVLSGVCRRLAVLRALGGAVRAGAEDLHGVADL